MTRIELRRISIMHGENTARVAVDVVSDIGGGVEHVTGRYDVTLTGLFNDGKDVAAMSEAVRARLTAAGVL